MELIFNYHLSLLEVSKTQDQNMSKRENLRNLIELHHQRQMYSKNSENRFSTSFSEDSEDLDVIKDTKGPIAAFNSSEF